MNTQEFQTLIPAAGVKVQQSEAGVVEPQNATHTIIIPPHTEGVSFVIQVVSIMGSLFLGGLVGVSIIRNKYSNEIKTIKECCSELEKDIKKYKEKKNE